MQRNGARVTVIVRTKNRLLLLKRALESVASQSYPHWRAVIVNDGGVPEPVDDIVRALDLRDNFTVVHNQQSLGMERAAQVGLRHAETEFLCVHDDDDTWDPSYLVKGVDFLDADLTSQYVAVVTKCEEVFEDVCAGQIVERSRRLLEEFRSRIVFEDLLYENSFPPIAMMARTNAVRKVGGFNENLPVLGDWDLNIRLLIEGEIGILDEVLSFYHVRRPGKSGDEASNSITAGLFLHERTETRYKNEAVRRLLNVHPEYIGLIQPLVSRIERLEKIVSNVGVLLPDHVISKIATEVWHEKKRWGIWYKISRIFDKTSRRSL